MLQHALEQKGDVKRQLGHHLSTSLVVEIFGPATLHFRVTDSAKKDSKSMVGKRSRRKRRRLRAENLEARRCLAASLGWDGPGQGGAELTYHIGSAPGGVDQAAFESAIETALDAWSDVVDVHFTEVSQPGLRDSLDFRSTRLDGAGGTLAQAYLPDDVNPARIAGDIEFDTDEAWEIGNAQGRRAFDLVHVAVHEIGHALGIDHLHEADATLAPFVSPTQSFRGLSDHDIEAALAIYAPAENLFGDSIASDHDHVGDHDHDHGSSSSESDELADVVFDTMPTEDTPETNQDWRPWLRNWFVNGGWRQFGGRMVAAPAHHNALLPSDVDGDGNVTPKDVLNVINWLVDPSVAETSTAAADTNNDGYVTPADVLKTINDLIRQASGESIGSDLADRVAGDADSASGEELDEGVTIGPSDENDDDPVVGQAPESPTGGEADDSDDETATGEDEDETEDETSEDDGEMTSVDTPIDEEETEEDSPSDDADDQPEQENPAAETPPVSDEGGASDDAPDADGGSTDMADDNQTDPASPAGDESPSEDGVDSSEEHCPEGHFGGFANSLIDRAFATLDANSDGALTEAEVGSGIWALVQPIDADEDGAVTMTEVGAFRPNVEDRRFNRLDDNGDGAITVDEVNEAIWQRVLPADADNSESVTQEELQQYRDSLPSRLFRRLDDNGDLSITQDEVNERIWERLSDRDANEDGVISPDELSESRRPRVRFGHRARFSFPRLSGMRVFRF